MNNTAQVVRLLLSLLALIIATGLVINQPPDQLRSERSFSWMDLSTLRGWLYPIEFNPHAKLPFIGSSLSAVAVSPDNRAIWVGGSNGALALSRDDGKSWNTMKSNLSSIISSIVAVSKTTIYLVTDKAFTMTDDGGINWVKPILLDDGTDSIVEWSVDPARKKVWVATQKGRLLSIQYEERWGDWKTEIATYNSDSESLCGWVSLYFDDKHDAGLFNCDGKVFHTSNGLPWSPLSLPESVNEVRAIALTPNGKEVWVFQRDEFWVKEGGYWSSRAVSELFNEKVTLKDFYFALGSNVVLASTNDRGLFRSMDHGKTWTRIAEQISSISDYTIFNNVIWLVTSSGGVFSGNIDSDSWTDLTVGSAGAFRRVVPHPVLKGELLVLGSSGHILESHNSGRSFSEFRQPLIGEEIIDIAVLNPEIIWKIGSSGLSTPKKDETESTLETDVDLRSIRFSKDGLKGLIGGASGSIWATEDSGPWIEQNIDGIGLKKWAVGYVQEFYLLPNGEKAWAVTTEGYILSSPKGVNNWAKQSLPIANRSLLSIWFVGEKHGWVAGTNGLIFFTENGGDTWLQQNLKTKEEDNSTNVMLYRIRFVDEQRGWAVGDRGVILATTDGGQKWKKVLSGTRVNLRDIYFDSGGKHLWVVGWGGTILFSEDGGITWDRLEGMEEESYRRFPAPWYWLFVTTIIIFALAHGSGAKIRDSMSIEAIATSDNPITSAEEDRFGFLELALAISEFVRNVNTIPPFIVAVTGEWGSGKSSVMHLVCRDLTSVGFRPIWFNAWHYQEETTGLASLMEHIRNQAAPPLLSFANIRFRWKLLHQRLLQPIGPIVYMVVGMIAVITWKILVEHYGGIGRAITDLKSLFDSNDFHKNFNDVLKWAGLTGIGAAVYLVIQLMKPFSGKSKILSGIWGLLTASIRVGGLQFDPGIRYRFAKEFSDLTHALAPARVVVIVDDLDRCHPERVINVLETVNFLVTAGKCIVVLGIDRERVLASISVAFEKVALAAADQARGNDVDINNVSPGYAYARSYLRKLVNLEVRVPTEDLDIQKLMFAEHTLIQPQINARPEVTFSSTRAFTNLKTVIFQWLHGLKSLGIRSLKAKCGTVISNVWQHLIAEFSLSSMTIVVWRFIYTMVFIALGWLAGGQLVLYAERTFPAHEPQTSESERIFISQNNSESDTEAQSVDVNRSRLTSPPTLGDAGDPVVVIPGSTHSQALVASAISMAAMLAIFAIWRIYFFGPVRDSRVFKLAIQHWSIELGRRLVTPREMKRFLNRVRFAALRVRAGNRLGLIPTIIALVQRITHMIKALGGDTEDDLNLLIPKPIIDEETLVRLAAFQVCSLHFPRFVEILSRVDINGSDDALKKIGDELALLDTRLFELLFEQRDSDQRAAVIKAFNVILGSVRY